MLKCIDCNKAFPLAARISMEKKDFDFAPVRGRVVVEKPCCPFCESINITEV